MKRIASIFVSLLAIIFLHAQQKEYSSLLVGDVQNFGDHIKGVNVRLDNELVLTKDTLSYSYVVKHHAAIKIANVANKTITFPANIFGTIIDADSQHVTVKFDLKNRQCTLKFKSVGTDSADHYLVEISADEIATGKKLTTVEYVQVVGDDTHYKFSTKSASLLLLKANAENDREEKIKAKGSRPK